MGADFRVLDQLRRYINKWLSELEWRAVRNILSDYGCQRRSSTCTRYERVPVKRQVVWYCCRGFKLRLEVYMPAGPNAPNIVFIASASVDGGTC